MVRKEGQWCRLGRLILKEQTAAARIDRSFPLVVEFALRELDPPKSLHRVSKGRA
jgi:hypothetical protein